LNNIKSDTVNEIVGNTLNKIERHYQEESEKKIVEYAERYYNNKKKYITEYWNNDCRYLHTKCNKELNWKIYLAFYNKGNKTKYRDEISSTPTTFRNDSREFCRKNNFIGIFYNNLDKVNTLNNPSTVANKDPLGIKDNQLSNLDNWNSDIIGVPDIGDPDFGGNKRNRTKKNKRKTQKRKNRKTKSKKSQKHKFSKRK
jgi:hypothetical protein